MTRRLEQLKHLYDTIERMKSAELRLAAAEMFEVVSAQQAEQASAFATRHAGREALKAGNRVDWLLAETAEAGSARRSARLETLKAERQIRKDRAELAYQASRRETGQMEALIEGERAAASQQQTRREQSSSDDRFGSRLHWLRGMRSR